MDVSNLDPHDKDVANLAVEALSLGKLLAVEYGDQNRLVEVHAVGISTAGKPCMRVWQVDGGSASGETEGWKLMSLAKVFKLPKLVDQQSLAPREGYKKGDLGMNFIFSEINL